MALIEVLLELLLTWAFPAQSVQESQGKFNGIYLLWLILFFGAAIVALLFAAA